jgi:hypothetical protein
MTPEAKFKDPEIHCSKFGDLSDTSCQVQGPPVNFSHACSVCCVQNYPIRFLLRILTYRKEYISVWPWMDRRIAAQGRARSLQAKRIGYGRIRVISYLFSYLCPDSDLNTDSIKNIG